MDSNIESNVKELIEQFHAPICKKCEKRRADRICINKACGPIKFMEIICGNCHSNAHANFAQKPEIKLEQYFLKLAQLLDQKKYPRDLKETSKIDYDRLQLVIEDFNGIRGHLTQLKCKIFFEIERKSLHLNQNEQLKRNIIEALSLRGNKNIQKQLLEIKKIVSFENNNFVWKKEEDFNVLTKIVESLDDKITEAKISLQDSFSDRHFINLEGIQFIGSNSLSTGPTSPCKANEGIIKVGGQGSPSSQYYMDYKLDNEKKYKIRVRFQSNPGDVIMMGIMPFSQVEKNWVFNIFGEYFCKRFYNNVPHIECSRILRGIELANYPKKGTQIEMRIDLKGNYMDFSDYPDQKNINSNQSFYQLQSHEQYVIAFGFLKDYSIIVEEFSEISQILEL